MEGLLNQLLTEVSGARPEVSSGEVAFHTLQANLQAGAKLWRE